MKTSYSASLKGLILLTLILEPALSMAKDTDQPTSPHVIIPIVAGVNIDAIPVAPDGDPVTLPKPLEALVEDRLKEMNEAPPWVKELRTKTVAEYFPPNLDDKSAAWADGLNQLTADASRLHEYFEQRDQSGLYKKFLEKKLGPFINQLNAEKLVSAGRHGRITRPIREWTVEILVVTEQVAYLGRYPNFIKNTLGLVMGRHLRGASAAAGVVALGAIGAYTAHHFNLPSGWVAAAFVGGALGGAFRGAFQAGPLAAILNAATAWFIQPTTEFIRVISARYTGPWEQGINHFYDKYKPGSSNVADAERNETPNIPTVDRDGMDFAGMSPGEQKQNWQKNLRMWVAVAKTFGQLLRDTHHAGRVLMMIAWSDEQLTTVLVETMDTKLINLAIKAETLLTPYKTALLANPGLNPEERLKALASLESNFDLYQRLNEIKWLDLDLNATSLAGLNIQIDQACAELTKAGMSSRDLGQLEAIQLQREKAITTIITALTLNEIRSFNVAEANRNLEGEARRAQRVIRNGFHLQDYVNRYREHVQLAMQKMGYQNARKPLPKSLGSDCRQILKPAGA